MGERTDELGMTVACERDAPQPIGPTGHLDTVKWWKEQYGLAIEVGQAKVDAVRNVHRRRTFDGDGYGWVICVEDRQKWPCATIVALDNAGKLGSEGDHRE